MMPMPMMMGGADKEERGMTDVQFKALVKMCLTLAESSKDAKEFRKRLAFPDTGYGHAFVVMLGQVADTLPGMDRLRQMLRDILMMEVE